MAVAQTMSGARAQVSLGSNIIGTFANVSYGVNLDVSPVNILGRFSPAELVTTGQEAISISCTGFRVVGQGPYAKMAVPQLQQLLNTETFTISIHDRQQPTSAPPIMTVTGCLSTGYSTSIAAKSLQELSVNYMGLILSDETGQQDEGAQETTLT